MCVLCMCVLCTRGMHQSVQSQLCSLRICYGTEACFKHTCWQKFCRRACSMQDRLITRPATVLEEGKEAVSGWFSDRERVAELVVAALCAPLCQHSSSSRSRSEHTRCVASCLAICEVVLLLAFRRWDSTVRDRRACGCTRRVELFMAVSSKDSDANDHKLITGLHTKTTIVRLLISTHLVL